MTLNMEPAKELSELQSNFSAMLLRKPVQSPTVDIALETLQYLRKVIIYEKYERIIDLVAVLAFHGRWLSAIAPSELVIRNVVMMASKLARDESVRIITGEPVSAFDALNELWIETEDNCSAASGKKLKKELIQAVNEVASEMSLCCENIAARARDLVTQNDVLIVHNLKASPTLSAFLVAARDVREYRLLLLAPAVFPDGSCFVPAGGLSICLSAERHSVPVYVLAAFYKITPFFVPDPVMVNPNTCVCVGSGVPAMLAKKPKMDVFERETFTVDERLTLIDAVRTCPEI